MTEALLAPLAARLPGLAGALDEIRAARHIEQALLDPGGQVRRVTPSTFWYERGGSCSLRYRVAVSAGPTGVTDHTVLARVYPSLDGADHDPVALSLFPADPDRPTLAPALDLAARAGEGWPGPGVPVSVELVHLPRQGAPVLRYGVRAAGGPSKSPIRSVYGKVYPDAKTGERAYRFLQSWTRPGGVRIPTPVGYSDQLHLLLTEPLPGLPVLPGIIRTAARLGIDPDPTSGGAPAYAALRSTGQALAALHQTPYGGEPVRTCGQLQRDLDAELDLVEAVWPAVADRLRSRRDDVDTGDDEVAPVLCHGDFTPAQVLIDGPTVSGIVDFDTVGWGDPAMDVGRFLAHLELLVAKEVGPSSERVRAQLTDCLLDGYADGWGQAVDEPFLRRVARHRALSLAMTALHACRQLKDRRMSLALSLLSPAHERIRS